MIPSQSHATIPKIAMTADGKTRFIERMQLDNILSFGPEGEGLELFPLNVLIGPNGSGKSNFIEAISLMRAAPRDYRDVLRRGGGVKEWLWKGAAERHPKLLECLSKRQAFLSNTGQIKSSCVARPPAQLRSGHDHS
jgi:predicted ATPase